MQRKVEDMDTRNLPIGREPMMMMIKCKLTFVSFLKVLFDGGFVLGL